MRNIGIENLRFGGFFKKTTLETLRFVGLLGKFT